MAVFKIIASRPIEKKDFDHKPQLDVQIISGNLNVDDEFVLYERHHPFNVIRFSKEKSIMLKVI